MIFVKESHMLINLSYLYSDYQSFMRQKIAFICKMLDSLNDRLKKMEQIRTHAEMNISVTNNNSDVELERIHSCLPVEDEENLKKLDDMLQDASVLNSMVSDVRIINVLVVVV